MVIYSSVLINKSNRECILFYSACTYVYLPKKALVNINYGLRLGLGVGTCKNCKNENGLSIKKKVATDYKQYY